MRSVIAYSMGRSIGPATSFTESPNDGLMISKSTLMTEVAFRSSHRACTEGPMLRLRCRWGRIVLIGQAIAGRKATARRREGQAHCV